MPPILREVRLISFVVVACSDVGCVLMQKLCKGFESKRKQGKAVLHSSGYGGSGFRFDQHEDDVHLAIKMRHAVDLKNPAEDGEDTAGDAARAALNTLRERTEAHGDGEAARIAAKYCVTNEQPPECINVSDVRSLPLDTTSPTFAIVLAVCCIEPQN